LTLLAAVLLVVVAREQRVQAIDLCPGIAMGCSRVIEGLEGKNFADFDFNVSAHIGCVLVLEATEATGDVDLRLFFSWGERAEPSNFDRAASTLGRTKQRLVIPFLRNERAHVHIDGYFKATPPSPMATVELRAEIVPIAVEALSVRSLPGCADATFLTTVYGGGFDERTTFTLRDPASGAQWSASETRLLFPSAAEVRFTYDAGTPPAAKYDLIATQGGTGPQSSLSEAFETSAIATCLECNPLKISVLGPGRQVRGEVGRFHIQYENLGDRVMEPRLLRIRLETPTGLSTRLLLDDRESSEPIEYLHLDQSAGSTEILVLTVGSDGRPELAPAESAGFSFEFLIEGGATNTDPKVIIEEFTPNRTDSNGLRPGDVLPPPMGMDPNVWELVQDPLKQKLEGRWQNYAKVLAEQASALRRVGVPTFSVPKLFRAVVAEILNLERFSITGKALDASSGKPLPFTKVFSRKIPLGPADSEVTTDGDGNFAIRCLPAGTYEVGVDGSPERAIRELGDGAGVGDVLLVATNPSAPTNEVLDPCPIGPLPRLPLIPHSTLFTPREDFSVHDIGGETNGLSRDPNEKDGPGEYNGLEIFPYTNNVYTIKFHNDAASPGSGPAETVEVIDNIDTTYFNFGNALFLHVVIGGKSYSFSGNGGCGGYSGIECWAAPPGSVWYNEWQGFIQPVPKPIAGGPSFMDCQFGLKVNFYREFYPQPRLRWRLQTLECAWPYCATSSCPLAVSNGFLHNSSVETSSSIAKVSYSVRLYDDIYSRVGFNTTAPNDALINFFDHLPPGGTPSLTSSETTCAAWNCIECFYQCGDCSPPGAPYAPCPSPAPIMAITPRKLETPSHPRPKDGAVVDHPLDYLAWKPVPGADEYGLRLWESTQSKPASPNHLMGDSFFCDTLKAGATYYWTIVARNENIDPTNPNDVAVSDESPQWQFTTLPPDTTIPFKRGDANGDGSVDLSDSVFKLGYLFIGGATPVCLAAADFNADGSINISGAVSLLNALFLGGAAVPVPHPNCGVSDLESDLALGCLSYPPCGP
jgi:hypothetical protein